MNLSIPGYLFISLIFLILLCYLNCFPSQYYLCTAIKMMIHLVLLKQFIREVTQYYREKTEKILFVGS